MTGPAGHLRHGNIEDTRPRWFLLTNSLNVRAWLSRGLAFPRTGFDKYYRDVPDLSDGALVLFPGPPGAELQRHVASEADDLAPVLLELQPESLTGQSRDRPVRFGGVLPAPEFRALHLPDKSSVANFMSRSFENVPNRLPVTPSPELFEEGRWGGHDIDSSGPVIGRAELELSDRLSGGLLGLAAATRARPREFRTLAAVINGQTPADDGEPFWLTQASHESGDPEQTLFGVVRDVLLQVDPAQTWRPSQVLDQVESRVNGLDLEYDVLRSARQHCDRIRSILRQDSEFEAFRDGGLDTLKALLLVLLRWQLDRQLAWSPTETGASPAVRRTATYLSGLMTRRSRIPTTLRPAEFEDLLSRREAAVLNEKVGDPWAGPAPTVEVSSERVDGRIACLLVGGGSTVLRRDVEDSTVRERLLLFGLAEERVGAEAIQIARAAGWDDLFSILVGPVDHVELLADRKGQVVLRLSGTTKVRTQLDDQAFLARLEASPLPDDVEQSWSDRLPVPTPEQLEAHELDREVRS